MTGNVDWAVLYLVGGVLCAGAGFGWWFSVQLTRSRHDAYDRMHTVLTHELTIIVDRFAACEQDIRDLRARVDYIMNGRHFPKS